MEEMISGGRSRVVRAGYWWRKAPSEASRSEAWQFGKGLIPEKSYEPLEFEGILHEDLLGTDGIAQLEEKTLPKQK